jgi:hypothetical protein
MDTRERERIQSLIHDYEFLMKGMDPKAKETRHRAYGGMLRAAKGMLVEALAKRLLEIAWEQLGNEPERLSLGKKTVKIPIKKEYIQRIKSPEVKRFVEDHIQDFYYPLRTDVHVHVDGKFKIVMECKAYTENAMLKRILVDFTLFKHVYPDLAFVLFQLESQLGGDYSAANNIKHGSPSTHTLLSYFDIDLNIITLLEGERKVDRPIHKPEYYKPLREQALLTALEIFKQLLK